MNRTVCKTVFFVMLLIFVAGTTPFERSRAIMPRDIWYIDANMKTAQAKWWSIFLGRYDMQLTRSFPGEGQVTFPANINYKLLSSGYIEGNGAGTRGPQRGLLPGMLIRVDGGQPASIRFEDIDYIYDWGTKVAMKDGTKGEFLMNAEGKPMEIRRFSLSEFRMVKGQWGEEELKPVSGGEEGIPIVALAFSREGAARAAKEPVSN